MSSDPFAAALESVPADIPWARAGRKAWQDGGGLPTRRRERWKYTGLQALQGLSLSPAPPAAAMPRPEPATADARRLTVLNGRLRPDLSDPLPDGVEMLEQATGTALLFGAEGLFPSTGLGQTNTPPMTALNAALGGDGVALRIRRGARPAQPLHIAFVNSGGGDVACHPRCVVLAEDNSEAVIFETHLGTAANGRMLVNIAVALLLRPGARLGHYKLQQEAANVFHLASVGLRLQKGAVYDSFVLQTGAALARHESWAALTGPDAELRLAGAVRAGGTQHIDNSISIDHIAPHCRSRMEFRTVLDDAAHGVLQGRVRVRREAQQTDSGQSGKTLLLSPKAQMDAKPELEIYADNVACSHGAAIGDLDPDQLFYLRGRGLPPSLARALLVEGFLAESIAGVADSRARDLLRRAAGMAS